MTRMTNFSDEPAKRMRERGFDLSKGYHGTGYSSAAGVPAEILPSEMLPNKTNNYPGTTHENRTYFYPEGGDGGGSAVARGTGSEAAWSWANGSRQEGVNRPFRDKPGTQVNAEFLRPVVHKVETVGHIDGDPVLNPSGIGSTEMTADRLRVTDTEWIRPPSPWSKEVGVQGTLPNDNWAKYRWAGDPGVGDGTKHDVGIRPLSQSGIKERFDFPPPAPKAAASKQFETLF